MLGTEPVNTRIKPAPFSHGQTVHNLPPTSAFDLSLPTAAFHKRCYVIVFGSGGALMAH